MLVETRSKMAPSAEVFDLIYIAILFKVTEVRVEKVVHTWTRKTKVNMINTWSMHFGEKTPVNYSFFIGLCPADCGYYIFTRFLVNTASNFLLSKVPSNAVHISNVRIFSVCLQSAYKCTSSLTFCNHEHCVGNVAYAFDMIFLTFFTPIGLSAFFQCLPYIHFIP
jgi:hypothetical protein